MGKGASHRGSTTGPAVVIKGLFWYGSLHVIHYLLAKGGSCHLGSCWCVIEPSQASPVSVVEQPSRYHPKLQRWSGQSFAEVWDAFPTAVFRSRWDRRVDQPADRSAGFGTLLPTWPRHVRSSMVTLARFIRARQDPVVTRSTSALSAQSVVVAADDFQFTVSRTSRHRVTAEAWVVDTPCQ